MAKQTEDERGRLDLPASTTARPKADRHGSDHKVGENWFLEMRASYGDSSTIDRVEFPNSLDGGWSMDEAEHREQFDTGHYGFNCLMESVFERHFGTRVAQQDETASSLGLGESDVEGIPSLSGHRPGPSTAGRAGRKLGFSFAGIHVRWASGRD
ncbi:hypothetical protein CKAH01_10114 [Colletotrichum kahawae]|uniref:Uncharacterized protein n=1 Tax=Colletotrichum kahawae TaxID=34407 RepID=A0AAE0CXR2_COLKA|nr:hypothetical protein CKAH01_10114 [Colletotrichum kahawae]